MTIALSLRQYLDNQNIKYDLLIHEKTSCSADTAQSCQISENDLAKGVLLKREKGYLLAVLPASQKLRLGKLGRWLRQPVTLATEQEIAEQFCDCILGALPPVGAAYGIKAVIDKTLNGHEEIYLEGGDHVTLVHMSGLQFEQLMQKVPQERFCSSGNLTNTLPDIRKLNYWGA